MTDSRLRFAVIGCGALARMQHIPNLLASSSACLHLCCDQSPEVLQFCRDHYGVAVCDDWRAAVMNPGVEAVCLATTEKLRYPVIALTAECGKPVYVEKPLGLTLAEILKIQQVVHESRIPFCVGHNRRSSPAMIAARRIFREQTGETLHAYQMNCRLELALRLLAQQQLSCKEVALRCGFRHYSSFVRAVRRRTGRTPEELRTSPPMLLHPLT